MVRLLLTIYWNNLYKTYLSEVRLIWKAHNFCPTKQKYKNTTTTECNCLCIIQQFLYYLSPQTGKFAGSPLEGQEGPPQGLGYTEDAAEHEQMTAVLRTSLQGGDSPSSVHPGLRTRTRATRGKCICSAILMCNSCTSP